MEPWAGGCELLLAVWKWSSRPRPTAQQNQLVATFGMRALGHQLLSFRSCKKNNIIKGQMWSTAFVNKVSLKHSHAHFFFLHIIYSTFHATITELDNGIKDHMALKA